MRSLKFLFYIVSLSYLIGCGENEQMNSDGAAPSVSPQAVSETTAYPVSTNNPVAVRINGMDITRSEIIRNGKVMLNLNMNKLRRTKVGKGERMYMRQYCFNAVNREVGRAAVKAYNTDRKLTIPAEVRESVAKDFTRRYGIRSKKLKRWHTIDDLKYMLGKNAFRVDIELDALANFQVAKDNILSNANIVVSDDQVNKRLTAIADYNANAQATNALVYANASNLWRRIQAQEISFEAAAKQYSQDEYIADGIEWGAFSKQQLEGESAVLALLDSLKPGDITAPVESDGGLAIIRLDEVDDQDNYSFSRIFYRLPMYYDVETEEQARHIVLEELESEQVNKIFAEYAGRLKIEYPNGPNIFAPGSPWAKITAKDFNN